MALNLHSPICLYGMKRKKIAFTVLFNDTLYVAQMCLVPRTFADFPYASSQFDVNVFVVVSQVLLRTQEHYFDLG